jgi:hypothetical protein
MSLTFFMMNDEIILNIFYRSIKGYLRDKICVLVTHQMQFLKGATKIIELDKVDKAF